MRQELREICAPVLRKVLNHPFRTGLRNGTLPGAALARFVHQDTGYPLPAYARALARCAADAPDDAGTRLFGQSVVGTLDARDGLRCPAKFALGMFAMGGSMLLMSLAAWHAHSVGRVSPLWLVGTYLLMGGAEAALAPVGMSVATAIAPAPFLSQVVGVFWLSAALGAGFGGNAMKLAGSSAPGAGLFLVLGAAAVGAGSVLLLSARGLARRLGV